TFDDLGSFTKVPVLARIPQITTKIELRRRRWRRPLAASAACIGIVVIVGLAYLVANGNESLVSLLARRGGSSGSLRVPGVLRARGEAVQRDAGPQVSLHDPCSPGGPRPAQVR